MAAQSLLCAVWHGCGDWTPPLCGVSFFLGAFGMSWAGAPQLQRSTTLLRSHLTQCIFGGRVYLQPGQETRFEEPHNPCRLDNLVREELANFRPEGGDCFSSSSQDQGWSQVVDSGRGKASSKFFCNVVILGFGRLFCFSLLCGS